MFSLVVTIGSPQLEKERLEQERRDAEDLREMTRCRRLGLPLPEPKAPADGGRLRPKERAVKSEAVTEEPSGRMVIAQLALDRGRQLEAIDVGLHGAKKINFVYKTKKELELEGEMARKKEEARLAALRKQEAEDAAADALAAKEEEENDA